MKKYKYKIGDWVEVDFGKPNLVSNCYGKHLGRIIYVQTYKSDGWYSVEFLNDIDGHVVVVTQRDLGEKWVIVGMLLVQK